LFRSCFFTTGPLVAGEGPSCGIKVLCRVASAVDESPFLSIIVPLYNEERNVPKLAKTLTSFFGPKGFSYETILVDDGSEDGTVQVAKSHISLLPSVKLLLNERNMGKGYSIRRGVLASSGQYVFFTDADLSTRIEHFDELLERVESGWDAAVGSRRVQGSEMRVRQSFLRRNMGLVFYGIVHKFVLNGVMDINCGFKLFRGQVARAVFARQRINGWGFDAEVLFILDKMGYSVCEVPVIWEHRAPSRVNVLSAPFTSLWELFKIRLNDWRHLYD